MDIRLIVFIVTSVAFLGARVYRYITEDWFEEIPIPLLIFRIIISLCPRIFILGIAYLILF